MAPFSRFFKHLPRRKEKTADIEEHSSTNAISTAYATDTRRPRTPQLRLPAPSRKSSCDTFASDSPKTTKTTSNSSSTSTALTEIRDVKDVEALILHDIRKGALHVSLQSILHDHGHKVYITEKIVRALQGYGDDDGNEAELQVLLRHASSRQKTATPEDGGFVAPAALAAALELFGVETGALLVLEFSDRVSVSESKLQRIVSGSSRAVEVMEMLLRERNASSSLSLPRICIDERWLLAVVANQTCGAELMSLIFQEEKDNYTIRITERVLEAAISNKGCATAILERLPSEHRLNLQTTPRFLLAACNNQRHAESIIDVLLDVNSGNKIRITEAMVQAARDEELSVQQEILVKHFGMQRPENMMKKAIQTVVRNFIEVEFTTFALRALAAHEDTSLLEFILAEETPAKSLKITPSMVEAAAASTFAGVKVMELLLRKRGHEVEITERVLQAAVRNKWLGFELINFFLRERPSEVFPTERVIEDAVAERNYFKSTDMLSLLLHNAKGDLRITTRMVGYAAVRDLDAKETLDVLLQVGKHDIQITARLVSAACDYNGRDCINTILEKWENARISKKAAQIISKIQHPETIALFLRRFEDDENVKEAVLTAAITSIYDHKEILAMVIGQPWDNVRITADMILAGTRNLDNLLALLEQLLRNGSALRLSEGALETIMEYCSVTIIEIFLKMLGDGIYITPKVMEAVVKNEREGDQILKHLLDKYGRKVQITEAMIQAAIRNKSKGGQILFLLLGERPDEVKITDRWLEYAAQESQFLWCRIWHSARDIPERAVEAVASNHFATQMMQDLLDACGDKIRITERTLEAAATNRRDGFNVLRFLFKALGKDIYVTERMVEAAASNTESGIQILELLMSVQPKDVWITERVLEAAAKNTELGDQIISLFFREYDDEIVISERVLEAACSNEKTGDKIVKTIVRSSNRSLPIRERVLEAAAGNASCGHDILALLLEQPDTKIYVTPKVLEVAAESKYVHVAEMLLKKCNAGLKLTERVVEACARDVKGHGYSGNRIIIDFVYARINDIQLTERVNELIASTWPHLFLTLLEERWEDVHVSERVLEEFARGDDLQQRKMMEELLWANEICVTPRIVQAAVTNEQNGEDLISFLLEEHGHKFLITEDIMIAAVKNRQSGAQIIDIILSERGQSDKIHVSEKLLQLAAQNPQSGVHIIDLLLQYSGDSFRLTDAIREAALGNESDCEEIIEIFRTRTGR